MTTITTFRIRPIPAAELDAIRSSGVDASGNPLEGLADAVGEPRRCCLPLSTSTSSTSAIIIG